MGPPTPFVIRIDRPGTDIVSIALIGELDMADAPELRGKLRATVEDPSRPVFIVDLTDLEFIDSSGIAALLEAANALKERDGSELIVAGSGRQVERLFAITQIDRVLRLVKSRDEALRHLRDRTRAVAGAGQAR